MDNPTKPYNLYRGRQTWVRSLPEGFVPEHVEVSSRALITHNDRILLVYSPNSSSWCLPGGRIEGADTLIETLHREVREEAAEEITPHRLVSFHDVLMPNQRSHKFEFIFHATLNTPPSYIQRPHIDGDADTTSSPVTAMRWFTLDELQSLTGLFPAYLRNWPEMLGGSPRVPYYRGCRYHTGIKNDLVPRESFLAEKPVRRIRVSVRGVGKNKQGESLLVRDKSRNYWYFAGGGLEPGETMEATLLRELEEETGHTGKLGNILCVEEFVTAHNGTHQIEIYTQVHFQSEGRKEEFTRSSREQTGACAFMSPEHILTLPAYPVFIHELVADESLEDR